MEPSLRQRSDGRSDQHTALHCRASRRIARAVWNYHTAWQVVLSRLEQGQPSRLAFFFALGCPAPLHRSRPFVDRTSVTFRTGETTFASASFQYNFPWTLLWASKPFWFQSASAASTNSHVSNRNPGLGKDLFRWILAQAA